MEEHASRLATAFIASMTHSEREAFRARFMRLDAPLGGSPERDSDEELAGEGEGAVGAGKLREPTVTPEQLHRALHELGTSMKDPAFRRQLASHLNEEERGGGR